jgi:hypothetical protein
MIKMNDWNDGVQRGDALRQFSQLCCINGRVVVWSRSPRSFVPVQGPSFPCGYHSGVRSLVLQVWDSYRDLAEMMQERGVDVDPSTIMRWVHRYVHA